MTQSLKLKEWHEMVWQFRDAVEHNFPTPNRSDSLAFAFTEVAEAIDAQLRQNSSYQRRSEKSHSVEQELTQCAMMLLTAVSQNNGQDTSSPWTLRQICYLVAGALATHQSNDYLLAIVEMISTLVDLSSTLPVELARLQAKFGPPADDGPASLNEVANEHVIEYG